MQPSEPMMTWSFSSSHEVQIQVAITKVRHHSVALRSRRPGRANVNPVRAPHTRHENGAGCRLVLGCSSGLVREGDDSTLARHGCQDLPRGPFVKEKRRQMVRNYTRRAPRTMRRRKTTDGFRWSGIRTSRNSLSSCYSMRRRNHRARTIKLKYRRSGWYMGLASRSPCAT